MLLPIRNDSCGFHHSAREWMTSSEGYKVLKASIGVSCVALVAAAFLRTPLFIMPAYIMSGFYLGCLVKNELVKYNTADIFFCKAYLAEGRHRCLRWIVLAIVFVSYIVFPLLSAVAGALFGVYCGLLY